VHGCERPAESRQGMSAGRNAFLRATRRAACVVLGLELAFLLGFFSCHPVQTSPGGYSCASSACTAQFVVCCGTPPSGAGFFEPSIVGYSSSIYVTDQISGGNGFVKNSLILISGISGPASVEAGYIAQGVTGIGTPCVAAGTFYFLQETSAAGVIQPPVCDPVPQADFGHYAVFQIENIANGGSAPTFAITVTSPSETLNFGCTAASPCAEALWTPPGSAGHFASLHLGETLVGSQGASAGTVLFVNNSFQASPGVPSLFPFQSDDGESDVGGVTSDNPPFGLWVQSPSIAGSNGGSFYTECCAAPTTVFPASLMFGTQTQGTTSAAQTVLITNTSSTGTLTISHFGITGPNAVDFAQASPTTCTNGTNLGPAASCTISITFTPSTQTSESGTLTVTDSGGSGSGSDTASLSGTGAP